MKSIAISCALLSFVGCAHPAVERQLNWSQVQAFGEIELGDPSWDAETLRIPIKVRQHAGDSISVLSFDSQVAGDLITISARRRVVSDNAGGAQVVRVRLPESHPGRYRVVYEGPDGIVEPLCEIEIPASTESP